MKFIKKNKKILISIVICILILILILFTIDYSNKYLSCTLTQLAPTTESQMMGYTIKTKNDKLLIIDGGTTGDSKQLLNVINKNNNIVDAWILTHPHKDHFGAFVNIVENNKDIKINNIYTTLNTEEWYNTYAIDRKDEYYNLKSILDKINQNNKISYVNLGEEIVIDNIKVEVLGVVNPEIIVNPVNNSSMVFKVCINYNQNNDRYKKNILFLADSGIESGNKLLDLYGNKLKSDIVQMAHHGQAGVSKEVYEKINPEICLWPTSKWLFENDSGKGFDTGSFLTQRVYEWVKEIGVTINYLAFNGNKIVDIWE